MIFFNEPFYQGFVVVCVVSLEGIYIYDLFLLAIHV